MGAIVPFLLEIPITFLCFREAACHGAAFSGNFCHFARNTVGELCAKNLSFCRTLLCFWGVPSRSGSKLFFWLAKLLHIALLSSGAACPSFMFLRKTKQSRRNTVTALRVNAFFLFCRAASHFLCFAEQVSLGSFPDMPVVVSVEMKRENHMWLPLLIYGTVMNAFSCFTDYVSCRGVPSTEYSSEMATKNLCTPNLKRIIRRGNV